MPSDAPSRNPSQPLRLVYYAWLFGSFWSNITTGATLTRFARALGASDAAFGLLASIFYLCAFVQVPVSYFVERSGSRKRWFIIGGLVDRGTWLLMTAIPWVLPPQFWWEAFLLGYTLAVIGTNVVAPCWVSWMGDLLPQRIRGRFSSARSRLGQYMTLLLPLPIGWLLDHAAISGDFYFRATASGLLGIASLVGLIDILMHIPVPEIRRPRPAALPSFRNMMLQPLRDRNFRKFLVFNATLVFSVGFLGQYYWLYCFDILRLSTFKASLLMIVGPSIVAIFFSAIYGPLIDKMGRKPLIMTGAILIAPGTIGWIFMSAGHLLPGYLLVLITAAGWPAIDIGRLNVLLGMSGSRAGRGSGIAYFAVFSIVCAISGTLSGCFGSAIVHTLGTTWRAEWFGIQLSYHSILFIISTALRIFAIYFLARFHEPHAFATRDAIQYVAIGVVTNLQLTVTTPFRFLRRISTTAFKVRPLW